MEGSSGVCSEWENINGGEIKAKDGAGFASREQNGSGGAGAASVCTQQQ